MIQPRTHAAILIAATLATAAAAAWANRPVREPVQPPYFPDFTAPQSLDEASRRWSGER